MPEAERLAAALKDCPEWFHSIELAPGVVTPGRKSVETLNAELHALKLPDVRGKSVLDVGAYDGFFSFAAERLGAARVVALDHYVWSTDMVGYVADWRRSQRSGIPLPPPHESSHWHPEQLPGRRPFDLARGALSSKVEAVVGDFMTMDLSSLGRFDVVLFLGVLYHLENPFEAMKRLKSVTAPAGLAIIETEAMEIPGTGDRAFCEFFPGQELNNDPSNWWSPNAKALEGFGKAAGFRKVSVLTRLSPTALLRRAAYGYLGQLRKANVPSPLPSIRYRAFVHAEL
jgi:tRNA (mo5U34)-methyltransferase